MEMSNYAVVQLMRTELACVKRAATCGRQCAACDLVQDDKELIEAYKRVIDTLQDPQTRHVTFCCLCDYWDKESGLTARMCEKHQRITTRYDYCSNAKEVSYNGTP